MKRFLEIGGVAAGVVLIAFGVAAIVMGVNGRNTVSSELSRQQIVGPPDFSPSLYRPVVAKSGAKGIIIPTCTVANQHITSGSQARCFAQYLQDDALMATGGYYFAQQGIYTAAPNAPKSQLMPGGGTDNSKYALMANGQPVQNGARQIWTLETALGTALNASYMADQTSLFGIVVGIALLLSGFGFLILALGGALENEFWAFKRPAVKKAPEATPTPLSV
ncbi:MAG TPA: hypothetical protein VKR79_10590 [Gaiellaceae bacterium]|nr:hypothetical protein [Gaiellaceae bacterium]